MRKEIQHKIRSQRSPADSHWRKTLPLQRLWKKVFWAPANWRTTNMSTQRQENFCVTVEKVSKPPMPWKKKHSILHKDVKDYECHICEKSFKGNQHLKYHMQIHINMPIACGECGKIFKKKSYLTSHMQKLHTGESDKPYSCPFCGQSFVIKSHMNSHAKKQHPKIWLANWQRSRPNSHSARRFKGRPAEIRDCSSWCWC